MGYFHYDLGLNGARLGNAVIQDAVIHGWSIPILVSIQIFVKEQLGKGCFGEVYRGHVTRQTGRKGPGGGGGWSKKFSLTHGVAVKKLKGNYTTITTQYYTITTQYYTILVPERN